MLTGGIVTVVGMAALPMRQRHRCQTCGATFTETKCTIFYRRRTSEDEIIDTLALIAEGNRISSLVRARGH